MSFASPLHQNLLDDEEHWRARQPHLALHHDYRPLWTALRGSQDWTEAGAATAFELARHPRPVSYSRNSEHYRRPKRYREMLYTFRNIVGAIDWLEELGLIEHIRQAPGPRGWQSAAMANQKLRTLIQTAIGSEHLQFRRPAETIVLKNGTGRLIDYADTKRTMRMRRNLDDINEAIGSADLPPELKAPMRRVFNGDFDRGGRFYAQGGGWQIKPQAERALISINGEATIELDYQAMHPRMIYAQAGKPYPSEPYDIPPWPRALVKLGFLILVNARTPRSALGAISHREEIRQLGLEPGSHEAKSKAMELLEDIKQLHSRVAHAFASDMGAELMRLDADIAEKVMLRLLRQKGIIVLPVHDSFIGQASNKDVIEEAMMEEFQRKMKADIQVTG